MIHLLAKALSLVHIKHTEVCTCNRTKQRHTHIHVSTRTHTHKRVYTSIHEFGLLILIKTTNTTHSIPSLQQRKTEMKEKKEKKGDGSQDCTAWHCNADWQARRGNLQAEDTGKQEVSCINRQADGRQAPSETAMHAQLLSDTATWRESPKSFNRKTWSFENKRFYSKWDEIVTPYIAIL